MYALGFYAPHAGAGVRYGATMAMHLIVDRVTAVHGTKGETTIRGRDQSVNPFIFYMRRAYASYQVTCSQTPRTCTILCDFAVSAHNVSCAPSDMHPSVPRRRLAPHALSACHGPRLQHHQ